MQEGTIGRRYAKALAETVGEKGAPADLQRIDDELSSLAALIHEKGSDFRHAMLNPSFADADRQAILDAIAEQNKFHDVTRNFLRLLVEKGRLPYLELIAQSYGTQVDERTGRVRARITSAKPLTNEQRETVLKALEKRVDKTVVAELNVDPIVISGIKAQIGGLVFDGTLKSRLDRLRHQIV